MYQKVLGFGDSRAWKFSASPKGDPFSAAHTFDLPPPHRPRDTVVTQRSWLKNSLKSDLESCVRYDRYTYYQETELPSPSPSPRNPVHVEVVPPRGNKKAKSIN